jgi:hypothetical protein
VVQSLVSTKRVFREFYFDTAQAKMVYVE